MIELLGKMQRSFLTAGSNTEKYFNSKGELRYIKKLGPQWSLADVLCEKYQYFLIYIGYFNNTRYKYPREEAESFASFLLPMLVYSPSDRYDSKT